MFPHIVILTHSLACYPPIIKHITSLLTFCEQGCLFDIALPVALLSLSAKKSINTNKNVDSWCGVALIPLDCYGR